MTSYYATILPNKTGSFISMDQAGDYNSADLTASQRLIEKLMYLACSIWPDIFFVVGLLSQYNSDPRVGYFCIAKQVLCYLKETINLEIV